MATFTTTPKASIHYRSISLPSRCHPLTANVEKHLHRLRASEETSTSSLSIKCNKLAGLKDLYECVDDLLQLPGMQQSLSSYSEYVLCGSLRLLDLCSTIKDAFLQMRVSVQDLESSLRRREADVSSKVGSYLICKKKVNKMVSKCFASLKKLRNNKINEISATVSLLGEVEEVSITIFESLFSLFCPVLAISKQNGWSSVSKLTRSTRLHCEGSSDENINQVQKLDMALEALYRQKSSQGNDILSIQEVQTCLMALDMNMQECEKELDCLSRSVIKTRVSLLNVLNH